MAHLLVIRGSSNLFVCRSQPNEKMLALPLGLWSKAGEVPGGQQAPVRLGGLRDQAHKFRESSLPALGLASAVVSGSVSLYSTGTAVVLEPEMSGT